MQRMTEPRAMRPSSCLGLALCTRRMQREGIHGCIKSGAHAMPVIRLVGSKEKQAHEPPRVKCNKGKDMVIPNAAPEHVMPVTRLVVSKEKQARAPPRVRSNSLTVVSGRYLTVKIPAGPNAHTLMCYPAQSSPQFCL